MIAPIRRHPWLALLPLFALLLLAAAPVLSYPMGRDQGMYANIGRSILAGGTPFVDMWDIKPPPIYYLYAVAIGLLGPTSSAVRALDFALVPLGALALFGIGKRLSAWRVGVLAAGFYMVFYFTETFASLSQNDSLVTVPMAIAASATLAAMQSPRASRRAIGWSLLAGLLSGLILWFKHYNAFFVGALVLNQLIVRRGMPWREALAFSIGGLITGGALLAFFASRGMVQEMLIVAQGTAGYNAQGYDFRAFISSMGHYLSFRWAHWGPMLVLALLWPTLRELLRRHDEHSENGRVGLRRENLATGISMAISVLRGHERPLPPPPEKTARSSRRPSGWLLVGLWLLAGLLFALIQAKGFDTHWLLMLPPLALLAADSLDRLVQLLRGESLRAAVYLLVVLAGAGIIANSTWARAWPYYSGEISQEEFYRQFQANDLKPWESLAVVDYLRERVAPGDTIYIWGFRPEVAYLGGWRPATRYQAHFPLVAPWYPQDWKQNNVDILWAAMPPYALVMMDDYMPWVTDRNEDSHQILQDYTELNNWLIANYERETRIGDFIVWRRQGS